MYKGGKKCKEMNKTIQLSKLLACYFNFQLCNVEIAWTPVCLLMWLVGVWCVAYGRLDLYDSDDTTSYITDVMTSMTPRHHRPSIWRLLL